MRILTAFFITLALGCSISPVVTDPMGSSATDRYSSCRRAAKDYCRDALDTPPSSMDKCVAEATFKCTTGES